MNRLSTDQNGTKSVRTILVKPWMTRRYLHLVQNMTSHWYTSCQFTIIIWKALRNVSASGTRFQRSQVLFARDYTSPKKIVLCVFYIIYLAQTLYLLFSSRLEQTLKVKIFTQKSNFIVSPVTI